MTEYITISDGDDDDEIISMPGPSQPRISQPLRAPLRAPIFIDDSDDDDPLPSSMHQLIKEVISEPGGKRKAPAPALGPTRSAFLDMLDSEAFRMNTPMSEEDLDESLMDEPTPKKKKTAPKKPKADAGAQKDKAEEAARKRLEKEEDKIREKEVKARLKEEEKLAKEIARSKASKEKDANKLSNKHDSVREIVVYITPDLATTSSPIAAALPEIRGYLEENLSQMITMEDRECTLDGTIRFKRHIKAKYIGKEKKWVTIDKPYWKWESTVVLVVRAEEIVDLIATKRDGLAEWAGDARLLLNLKPTDQILVMIRGLTSYYAKSRTLENRVHTATARAGLGETSKAPSKKQQQQGPRLDKARIEGELVRLQVAEGCCIIHVEKTEEIESWIKNFAGDIAYRPKKLLEKSHLGFHLDGGAGKGTSASHTLELMLGKMEGITSFKAKGITAQYPTFRILMEAYDQHERRGTNAESMLVGCEVSNLRNGTMSQKTLGPALSKKVYRLFRGEDSLALS